MSNSPFLSLRSRLLVSERALKRMAKMGHWTCTCPKTISATFSLRSSQTTWNMTTKNVQKTHEPIAMDQAIIVVVIIIDEMDPHSNDQIDAMHVHTQHGYAIRSTTCGGGGGGRDYGKETRWWCGHAIHVARQCCPTDMWIGSRGSMGSVLWKYLRMLWIVVYINSFYMHCMWMRHPFFTWISNSVTLSFEEVTRRGWGWRWIHIKHTWQIKSFFITRQLLNQEKGLLYILFIYHQGTNTKGSFNTVSPLKWYRFDNSSCVRFSFSHIL